MNNFIDPLTNLKGDFFHEKMKSRLILILTIILTSLWCQSQNRTTHNNQQWIQYYNQLKFSEHLTIFSDASIRRNNKFDQWSQITLRVGLGYPIIENLNGITGIACFESFNNDKPFKIEFRPYQEINTSQKFGAASIQHRLRFEARYFRKIADGVITSNSNFNFRFRYRLFCGIPILKLSDSIPERKLILNIGDEVFINTGKEIKYNMLDNNRFLVGLSFQVNANLTCSFLYNYQFGQRSTAATYEHSDVFWLGITHKVTRANYKPKQT